MEPGQNWSSWWRRCPWLLLGLLAGCAASKPQVDKALMADRGTPSRNEGVAEQYTVRSPDVLELPVAHRPELCGRHAVSLDGRIDLGNLGRLRVEGLTVSEITRLVSEVAAVPPNGVQVRVVEYNSQQVYLCGEGNGLQRAVAYQGPETVLDLLQRVGGITPGAAPRDVSVVRSHVAEGRTPEVLHVDLQSIVLKKDQRTNLRLQPFDQIYIGETRRSSLEKCVPPCLRPLYKAICGLSRPDRGSEFRVQTTDP